MASKQVLREVEIESPPTEEKGIKSWLYRLVRDIKKAFNAHIHIFPESLNGELRVNSYTITGTDLRPAPAQNPGGIIYVSDAAVGAKFQGSDGTNWVNLG